MTFDKGDIIDNVVKDDTISGFWKGDLNEQVQKLFPSSYVREIEDLDDEAELETENTKSEFDLLDDTFCLRRGNDSCEFLIKGDKAKGNVCRFSQNTNGYEIRVRADNETEQSDWYTKIIECFNKARTHADLQLRSQKKMNIAKELSDLIVYCSTASFDKSIERSWGDTHNSKELCSISESKIDSYISYKNSKINEENYQKLVKFNKFQLSRIYPKGNRFDSSNFNPHWSWLCGCQLVSLNYQTGDKNLQLNNGLFRQNGRCGYVLRPDFLNDPALNYNPFSRQSIEAHDEPLTLSIFISGGQHLAYGGKNIASPYVEVEITGAKCDNDRWRTRSHEGNALCPVWNDQRTFDIANPSVAILRFYVCHEDMFSDKIFLGQFCIPVKLIRTGYRSVPLRNAHDEPLDLASLLVHIDISYPRQEKGNHYATLDNIRHELDEVEELLKREPNETHYNRREQLQLELRKEKEIREKR